MDLQARDGRHAWCRPCLQATTQLIEQILITTGQPGERLATSSTIPLSFARDFAGKCPLCRLLRASITPPFLAPERVDIKLCFKVSEPNVVYVEEAIENPKAWDLYRAPLCRLSLESEPETHIGSIVPGRRVSEPGSEAIRATIRRWTKECDANHAKCQRSRDSAIPSLPTRVLDVSNGESPSLFVSNGSKGRYVALSHCWGNTQLDMTTKDNFETFQGGIGINSLSKTVRDAIKVVQWLGLRYLWVDSLCIIQDDQRDWSREAMRMGDIYEKAYCTIAATAAINGNIGCFAQNTQDHPVLPLPSSMEWTDQVYLSQERKHKLAGFDVGPLERLLSPRSIHFTDDQVYWECLESTVSETGLMPPLTRFSQLRNSLYKGTVAGVEGPTITNLCREAKKISRELWLLYFWVEFVELYSVEFLSFATDKILALQGMANRIDEMTSLKFCAGTFFDAGDPLAARSLLWRRAGAFLHRNPMDLPSWSWASLDGAIKQVSSMKMRSPGRRCPLEPVSQIREFPSLSTQSLLMYGPVIAAYRPGPSPAFPQRCVQHMFNVPEPRFMVDWESHRKDLRRGDWPGHGPLKMWEPDSRYDGPMVHNAAVNMLCFDVEDCQPEQFFITPLFKSSDFIKYYLVLEKLVNSKRAETTGNDSYRRIGLAFMLHRRDDRLPPSVEFFLR